ncbi:MAG: DUF444 family protein [Arhodomonas sp.]|nr:DUF444 family protein [Arhodomonas sp.]
MNWSCHTFKPRSRKQRRGRTAYIREGWDRRGARSRLDRRRTMREAIKRRSATGPEAVPITNDDLRFRQLARRRQPSTNAVAFLLLDVSSSMDDHCRRLAKTFFFWALAGDPPPVLRGGDGVCSPHRGGLGVRGGGLLPGPWPRRHAQLLGAAQGRRSVLEAALRPSPRYNCYLFYATDGHNFSEDRGRATEALMRLAPIMNFMGYVEVSHHGHRRLDTEVAGIWRELAAEGVPCGSYALSDDSDIWPAIRAFFTDQADAAEAV